MHKAARELIQGLEARMVCLRVFAIKCAAFTDLAKTNADFRKLTLRLQPPPSATELQHHNQHRTSPLSHDEAYHGDNSTAMSRPRRYSKSGPRSSQRHNTSSAIVQHRQRGFARNSNQVRARTKDLHFWVRVVSGTGAHQELHLVAMALRCSLATRTKQ